MFLTYIIKNSGQLDEEETEATATNSKTNFHLEQLR